MTLIDTLETLVKRAPGGQPEDVAVIEPDGDRLPDGAWEELEIRYLNAVIASVWGPPEFNGSWTDPNFPKWHHWVAHLAFWRRPTTVAYIECDQQDNELPAAISVGALSEQELVELSEASE
jgi:hypothetical protein